jgi:outer membrane protein assembly factor BamB
VIEPPLASDGRLVFVATRQGSLRALDPSGAAVWRRDGPPGRIAAAPGLLVIHEADGTVSRLETETGVARWTSHTTVAGTLPPVLDGDRVLVAGEGVAALELVNGRSLWSVPGPPAAASAPVPHGRLLLVGEVDGTLRARDRSSGASVWTFRTGKTLVAPPLVDDDGHVFVGTTDRRFLSLGHEHGHERWRWKVGADVEGAATALHKNVLFASFEDVLYALRRGNGHMDWRAPLPSRPLSGPLCVGESVLIACYESDILGFEGKTGRKLGTLKTPAEIRTPPLLVGDRLYVGLRDRSLVAYTLDMTPAKPAPQQPQKGPGKGQGRRSGSPPNVP